LHDLAVEGGVVQERPSDYSLPSIGMMTRDAYSCG